MLEWHKSTPENVTEQHTPLHESRDHWIVIITIWLEYRGRLFFSAKYTLSWANKCKLMVTSRSRELTEPAIFVLAVAKKHCQFILPIAVGVLVSARASFWLDEISRKLVERFNEVFPKPELVPPSILFSTRAEAKQCVIKKPVTSQRYPFRHWLWGL